MNFLKIHYKFGNDEIKPKDILLILISSIVGSLTSIIIVGGTEKLGYSLFNVVLLISVVMIIMPMVIFVIMGAVYHFFDKGG